MDTAALDKKAFWHNVWDEKKKKDAIYNRYHRQKSGKHWQVGPCCVGKKYYAEDKYREDIKSCDVKEKVMLFCSSVMEASQWYPPCCPLSVQPTSFKRRAYQMGFSLNRLEAKELKCALQRDSSVSEITLNQNNAFNLAHIFE